MSGTDGFVMNWGGGLDVGHGCTGNTDCCFVVALSQSAKCCLTCKTIEQLYNCITVLGTLELCIEFWWGNLKERHHLGNPVVDGRIILRWILRKWNVGVVDWIDLAQYSDCWRELANAVMNFRVP
jgi:hypothetical protein